MPNLQQIAMNLISRNPAIANNPRNKELMNVIASGDSQRGQEIANNLLQSYGVSRDEALQMAQNDLSRRFGIPF